MRYSIVACMLAISACGGQEFEAGDASYDGGDASADVAHEADGAPMHDAVAVQENVATDAPPAPAAQDQASAVVTPDVAAALPLEGSVNVADAVQPSDALPHAQPESSTRPDARQCCADHDASDAPLDTRIEVATAIDARPDGPRSCRGIRWVLPELRNARDLSGTLGGGGGVVSCGHLYRGPAPVNLSEAGCSQWAELGIRTVIDLRNAAEIRDAPTSDCVRRSVDTIEAPMSATSYLAPLDNRQSMAMAFTVLADPSRYPVYLHCSRGVDRTGVLVALVLTAIEAPPTAVTAEYELSAEAGFVTDPQGLAAMAGEVDRRGGILAYLAGIGITPAQIRSIRYTLQQ